MLTFGLSVEYVYVAAPAVVVSPIVNDVVAPETNSIPLLNVSVMSVVDEILVDPIPGL